MNKYKNQLELIFLALYLKPDREYKFHPERRWRLDYAFPGIKLAIEYEGMAYKVQKSRHTTIKGFTGDLEKYNELSIMGWRLLRFNAQMIKSGKALEQIEKFLKKRRNEDETMESI